MSTQPIDYAALAKQAGATESAPAPSASAQGGPIDYAALAKQAGSVDYLPAPTPEAPKPRTWADSVGDFGSELWKQVNPVSGIKGLAQATAHPVDTFMKDADARKAVYDKAEEAFKKGNYTEGAAHLLYSALPLVGPQLDEAGNNFIKGNYAKGAGASVGMGLGAVAPEILKGVPSAVGGAAQEAAGRMYQSALKPSTTYGTQEVGNMVKTGLDNAIPVSPSGVKKISMLVGDLNDKIKSQIDAGSQSGVTVDPQAVAQRTDQLKAKFANQVTPESDLAAIKNAKDEFLRNNPNPISANQAQALKQGTYRQLTSKNYGELGSATEEAQKALARGIKEELETPFPEISGMNAKEGQLIGLDGALERAVKRINNRDIFSLGGKIAGGAGAALGAAGHEAGLGAVAGIAMHYALTDPMVQSKLAIAMNRASKGAVAYPAALTRVQGYANALGNAANAQASGDQTSQQPPQ